jgi:hypothetical protein
MYKMELNEITWVCHERAKQKGPIACTIKAIRDIFRMGAGLGSGVRRLPLLG